MPIHFAKPIALALLLCVIPIVLWARRSMAGLGRPRWITALCLRLAIVVLLVLALAQLQWWFVRDEMTVIYALDMSLSIPGNVQKKALDFVRESAKNRPAADSAGLVLFGRGAALEKRPDTTSLLGPIEPETPGRGGVPREAASLQSVVDPQRTNIASALRLALATFPSSSLKRIVLVSDGNENLGSAAEELEAARRNHVRVDVMPIRYEYGDEVMVEKVLTPGEVDKGAAFEVRTVVSSTRAQSAKLSLYENARLIAVEKVELKEGRNVYVVEQKLHEPGYYAYTAEIEPTYDTLTGNNKASGFTMVRGAGRILLVEGDPAYSEPLRHALASQGLEVKMIGLDSLPLSIGQIAPYDAIILSNVPASVLGEDGMRAVELAVKDWGVGLVMIGGEHSFGPGGYQDSPIERALPVSMDIKQRQVMPAGALVVILHTCEIPEGNYWAKQTALAALRVLSASDEYGLLYYDYQLGETWLFNLQRVQNKMMMQGLIDKVQPGDMPSFITILQKAHAALKASHASVKHVILTSDGDPAYPGDAEIAAMVADGITISTVGIAPHSPQDTARLAYLATKGKGRYYDVQNPNSLPQIFIKEAATVRRSLISEDPFTPASALASEMVRGFSGGYPKLGGYVLTTAKKLAEVPLLAPEKDPLLAHWQYGLGRAVAFTSDAKPRWAAGWIGWSQFAQFWAQVMRWTARSVQAGDVRANVEMGDDRGHIVIDAIDKDGRFINALKFDGVLVTPDKKEAALTVSQTGPGRYEASFDAQETGTHFLSLRYTDEEGKTSLYTRGVVVPYSAEFRELRANEPLLQEIAAATQGRVLKPTDNVFERTFPPEANPRDAWPLLLLLAVLLVPADVFVRRVFLDWRAIRARAAAVVAWGTGAGRRASGKPTHAAVLLTTKAATREEMDRRARKFDRPAVPPSAGEAAADEPALGATGAEGKPEVRTAERPASEPSRPAAVRDDQTFTGRLLRAKKKLREEEGQDDRK